MSSENNNGGAPTGTFSAVALHTLAEKIRQADLENDKAKATNAARQAIANANAGGPALVLAHLLLAQEATTHQEEAFHAEKSLRILVAARREVQQRGRLRDLFDSQISNAVDMLREARNAMTEEAKNRDQAKK